MALSINDIKAGLTLLLEDQVWLSQECQHVKPGKGAAFVRVKMRNLKTGNVLERTFRGDEKIEQAFVEERKLQYQYNTGEIYHFMDQDTYEEISISKDAIGDEIKFLKDNLGVQAYFFRNEPLNINLPNFIEFEITDTEPGIKGDTAKSDTKPAKIETG
ncbi:MAG: elongation factor P, partial [Candidatus Omnitrophica bacterium]|nr:elongation factor P [Candidatus Omnitrophota bacterium]